MFFLTGATGTLGTETLLQLLPQAESPIYVLVRAASTSEAANRLRSIWWEVPSLRDAVGSRIIPVTGDITADGLGVDEACLETLQGDITHLIHCAAETGIQKSREELWRVNVEGTRNVVCFAKSLGGLQRFVHVSTAYVAGSRSGVILEDDPLPEAFNSLYEESKAESERIVRSSGLPFTIVRPGMMVGNSLTGRTRYFNTIYYVLKLMLQGKCRLLPVSRSQRVNIAPADVAARQLVALATSPEAEGKAFHLTAPSGALPRAGELVDSVRLWAKDHLSVDIPRPIFISMPLLRGLGRRYNSREGAKRRSILSNLAALTPYFTDNHSFDRSGTDRLAGPYDADWHTCLPVMLEFACRHNFMYLTDKSVFQQALVRRESRHFPVTYYDIKADGVVEVTGSEMNAIIGRYVSKLRELGVKAGDTVALSGINCAEHAAIDSAIGLVGATSVPIYYTTPKDEVKLLLQKSGARWFFVGDTRMEQNVEGMEDVQVIRFGPLGSELTDADSTSRYPAVDPGSLATIRYTSGTTGEPKGVMFNYYQLKWMGEVLTNLLSWKDRNREMRYLSFLPMSHVVEGILASYAPYCMLCKAKIYYLNDFQSLTAALPKARPTVFFSVPRFYEKLWEQIEANPIGKKYLAMKPGAPRAAVGAVLRKAVLRKAGLNKCSQLIVGSAPMSEELLLKFRALGIEIHNAYGQTEAPLITINLLGDNVIPSIGTPLPDTTVTVTPEGELIVDGPQVALGYYRMESSTFDGGVLHTGDLGRIDSAGHVYIGGRKKDMLITSYGKNINCGKIEQRLTDIQGVEHAVLVGEARPFCTALIWAGCSEEALRDGIERMNASLSHPEQVKRWRIISSPLSIKNGELTPNLKVRRDVVISHFREEVESMYRQQ